MPPRLNFIIPCGTSQMRADKIDLLNIEDRLRNPYEDEVEDNTITAVEFFGNHYAFLTEITNKLCTKYNENQEVMRGEKNPFGAEISTLNALRAQEGWPDRMQNARYTILASNTNPGYFCANVLQNLIQNLWQCPEDCFSKPLDKWIVENLVDEPSAEQIELGMSDLVDKISVAIRPYRGEREHFENILVMSGGFKSAIPCLTLFSLFFGFEMVYLFEKSDVIQRLIPSIPTGNKEEREKWIEVCRQLMELNEERDSNQYTNYLAKILSKRVERYEFQ